MADLVPPPTHLEPSELGTREYWDNYYQNDLDQDDDADDDDENQDDENDADAGNDEDDDQNHPDPSELESWFDDVDAPAKVLEYLTSDEFPLSPSSTTATSTTTDKRGCSILDLGTGNGSMLFSLRLEGQFTGLMVGVDYSQQSVDLARKLAKQYLRNHQQHSLSASSSTSSTAMSQTVFEKFDIIRDDPTSTSWWSLCTRQGKTGFDLVLDKGTFDAISLSSDTVVVDDATEQTKRIHELYPAKVAELMAPGGFLVLTSCNWTEDEVIRWFTRADGVGGLLEVFGKIRYPVYEFGGQKGQGVASVCFRKRMSS